MESGNLPKRKQGQRITPPKGIGKFPTGTRVEIHARYEGGEYADLGVPEHHTPPLYATGVVVGYARGEQRYPYLVQVDHLGKYTYAEDELREAKEQGV